MNSFNTYYLGTLLRPSQTFTLLLWDPRRLLFGALALGINMLLYTIVYINLTVGHGAPSSFTPWLAIPRESYYFYNQFLLAPSMLICWLAAGGVVQLVSKLFGGKGTYEDTLSVLGFSIGVACWASLVHDLPDSLLGALGILDLKAYEVALNSPTIWRTILWVCYGTSFVLFVRLFWRSVQVVQKLNRWTAFGVGFLGFAVYQTLFLVFNR